MASVTAPIRTMACARTGIICISISTGDSEMKAISLFLLLCSLLCIRVEGTSAAGTDFIALCYHDVVSNVRENRDPDSTDAIQLAEQFSWLRARGYVPVSLSDIIAAREGKKALPDKAVLLTFDDG